MTAAELRGGSHAPVHPSPMDRTPACSKETIMWPKMWHIAILAILMLSENLRTGCCQPLDVQGPQFITEPPSRVHFLNSEGAVVTCRSRGDPPPDVTWITSDGRPLLKQRRLLEDFRNGTLRFYPFSPGAYRQDVHNAVYRCQAENAVGKILSRQVSVKAVIPVPYEIKLRDVTARMGDTIRFLCPVPNALRDEVSATSWVRRPDFNIFPTTAGGEKYHMIPTGDLIIRNIDKADEVHSFQCRTVHRLTGETTVSSVARIFIGDVPEAAVPGFVEAHSETISVRKGEPAILVCNFRGYSGLLKRWYRGAPNAGRALESSGRISIFPYALIITEARLEDSGAYFCDESESGSAQKRIFLRVTAALSVNLHPASQVVDLGHSGELVCSITGGPITGGVRWLKDGESLQETAGISLTGPDFSILRISRMEANFQGMYQCMVANEEDSAQGAAFVKLGAAKPRIKYKFIEHTLTADRFISLKCVAGGTPTPQIDWFLDRSHPPESNRFMIGQYLSSSGDVVSHVNITNIRPGDGGYYTCLASNKAGSDEHSAWLKVYGPPSVREIRPVSAVAGKDTELICPIGGHPLTITGWRKDNRNLPTDQRQKIMGNGTLLIRSVHPSTDDGEYFCTAQQGTHGQTATARVQLQIMVLPTLAALSFPENLSQGARLSETCTVTQGESPVQITWYKDGVEIGESSSSFPGSPAHRHLAQSSTSMARGNLDGLTVRDISQFTSLLSIDSLRAEHSGEYACEARNSAGIARSTALLKVYVPPQMSPFHPSRVLEAGSRVQLQCVVEKGDPPLSIVWTKDGRHIPEELSARVVGLDGFSSILTVDSVGAMHSGNYSCRASNRAGQSTITTVLIVRVPPTWRIEPMNASGLVDQPLSVPCEADGYPMPTIQWKRSRGPAQNFQPFLAYEGVQVAENGSMIIEKLSNSDGGLYLCEANNGIQNPVSKVISVIVNAPPSFSGTSQVKRFRVGSEARIECSASGDDPVRYQWFKDGNPIRPGAPSIKGIRIRTEESTTGKTKAVLDFDAVTAEAGGKYLCQATNSFGVSKLLVVVVVEEPPVAPTSFFLKNATSSSVVVGWDMGRQSTNVLTGFVLEYKEIPGLWTNARGLKLGGNASETAIADLTPHTRYELRISAVNDLGVSPPSPPLLVETESDLPTGLPLDVQVIPKTSTEIFVQWIPPPEETWNGHVLGYKVGRVVCLEKDSDVSMMFVDVPVETTSLAQSATLKDLRPYTSYCIAVKMFNDVGDGPMSALIEATTLEDVPGPPQQLKCQALTSESLSLAWRPPLENERHGEILGYQAFYHASDVDSEAESKTEEFQRETGVIAGLKKFTNYTLTLAAATKAGIGTRTEAIVCSTDEDVPGSPRGIKAVSASGSSVAVAWGPPVESNGVLVGYTVVQFPAGNSRRRPGTSDGENPEREIRLPPTATYHEMNNLDRRRRYRFCVAAHTKVGQSELVCSGSVSPSQKVPATILTFDGEVSGKSHSDVVLNCQHVGLPAPEVRWELPDGQKLVAETSSYSNAGNKPRLGIMPDGKLIIRDLGRNDSGNYTCIVTNDQATDNVSHRLVVKSLPSAPTLYLESVTSSSITVGWTKVDAGNSEIKRFVVNYKKAFGGLWEERSAGKQATSLSLASLDCGTSYQIYAAAVNEIGTGRSSSVLNAETKGGKPPLATPETILSVNATSAVLNFKTWQSLECPIQRFRVQYKAASSNWDWILVGDSFGPDSYVPIRGLVPGTTYILSLTALNPAGKTTLLHHFITRSATGDAIRPAMPSSNEAVATKERGLLYQPRFWVPVCTVMLAVVSVAAGVAYCVRARRLHRLRTQHQMSMGGELQKMKSNPPDHHTQAALYRDLVNPTLGKAPTNMRHYNRPIPFPGMEDVDVYQYATYHEVMDPSSSSNYKLLSDPPPPPRCLIHPPDAMKMHQMIVTPVAQGKQTNTYVPEATVLAGRPAKRFSRHNQHQHSRNEGIEPREMVIGGKFRGRRHSQPTSEPQTSDSGSERGEEDSEISATLGRIQRSRPGNTGRPHRPKSMAFKPDPGLS